MVQTIATHLIAFVLGGLLWPWVIDQVSKFKRKNN